MNIQSLFVDALVEHHPEVQFIEERLGIKGQVLQDRNFLFSRIREQESPQDKGKTTLFLTQNQGRFIRPCPGTRHYTCCGYKILHIGTYCSMDCSYCILQTYFHPPVLTLFLNMEEMGKEIDSLFSQNRVFRMGTGEFTDSLIWEEVFDLNPGLVRRFAEQDKGVLELKTKTCNVDRLPDLPHNRKTIVSFSLNTDYVVKTQERNTASIEMRLRAAEKCQKAGYPLAFHFDPMVIYPGCHAQYREVVRRLFQYVDPENIVWISLGAFRFMPELARVIERRFPESNITYGEFIPGLDGKMRYFQDLRMELYSGIIREFHNYGPAPLLYFCMEDDRVWRTTMGFTPKEKGGLSHMLDDSARKVCNLSLA